jgi:hypothetical protein
LRAAVVSPWALLPLLLASCGGALTAAPVDTPPAAEPEPDPETEPDAAPSPADTDTEPSEEEALLELVRGNIATTDLSAVVKIASSRVEGPNGAPPAATGYVNHVYEVEILTPISGCGALERFTFSQMAEADIRPMKDGTVLFVSVCRSGKGRYHTPDVGYAIPQSALPASALEELEAHPGPSSASACEE